MQRNKDGRFSLTQDSEFFTLHDRLPLGDEHEIMKVERWADNCTVAIVVERLLQVVEADAIPDAIHELERAGLIRLVQAQ